jgi:hypothetical protein
MACAVLWQGRVADHFPDAGFYGPSYTKPVRSWQQFYFAVASLQLYPKLIS